MHDIDSIMQTGDFVALGLDDGECPIGRVHKVTADWVVLGLKEFVGGCYDDQVCAVRLSRVREIRWAFQTPDGIVDDDALGLFQTLWNRRQLTQAHSS